MNKNLNILIITFLILFSNASYSQKLTASANETQVFINSQLQVTYSLTGGSADNFYPPSFKGFQVVGQSTSSGGGMTIIVNGKVVQGGGGEEQWIYFLVPTSIGKFTIDAAMATVNGKKIQSNTLTIEVVSSGSKTAKQQNQSNQNIPDVKDKDIFVKAFVNKNNPLQGEQIIVTYKIYTRVPISQYTIDKLSQFSGFWSQDLLKENEKIKQSNETINGVTYVVAEIRKVALFPQKSGTLTIAPLEIECLAQIKIKTKRNDPFADFFKDPFFSNFPDPFAESYQNVKKSLKSNALAINVKPLPSANKPDDFKGTVGSFSLSSQIDKTKLKTNEAANLKFTISGTGNIKLVEKPALSFPPDLETYDPKINDNINNILSGISGSRTFEYLVIPRSAGTFKIKPVSFSYFDLNKNKYITLTSPEYTLRVEKGSGNEAGAVVTGINKEELKYLGSDIQFIKNQKFALKPLGIYFYNSLNFYLLLLIPFLLFLIFVFLNRKRIKENSNIVLVKYKRATKVARKHLKTANKFLKENNKEKFYDEMFKAMWGYIGDKLSIPVSDLTKDNMVETLKMKNVEEELINKYLEILNYCEFARFAPSGELTEMKNLYSKTIDLISELEQKIK
ncbi:MAG: BatD family protein [Bacteroidales bacterium]|jgi:hypothetical protein